MNKTIFIDGPQLVGKTSLLKGLKNTFWYGDYFDYKFPFSDYTKSLGIREKSELNGFQLGKDLAGLYWISNLCQGKPILVDRGPMSSVYYSLALERSTKEQISEFLRLVSSYNNFIHLFITAKNQPETMTRDKNDGYDSLLKTSREVPLEILMDFCKLYKIRLIHFENDFSKSVRENVDNLCKLLKEEL